MNVMMKWTCLMNLMKWTCLMNLMKTSYTECTTHDNCTCQLWREGRWEGWQVATAPRAPAWDLRIPLYMSCIATSLKFTCTIWYFQMQRLLHTHAPHFIHGLWSLERLWLQLNMPCVLHCLICTVSSCKSNLYVHLLPVHSPHVNHFWGLLSNARSAKTARWKRLVSTYFVQFFSGYRAI